MKPIFFKTPAEFRAWLEKNHDKEKEIFVGFYKKSSGKQSITWSEAVDQALCFGWIDSVARRIDEASHQLRFTPRRPGSIWSNVNIKKVEVLSKQGLMQASGLKVFNERKKEKSGVYSFEQEKIEFPPAFSILVKQNQTAWKFFQSQALWYKRAATWYVISAKKRRYQATKVRNLNKRFRSRSNNKGIKKIEGKVSAITLLIPVHIF